MARKRGGRRSNWDEHSLRLRAAWMYYGHAKTQAEIAEQLNISRSSVIRLLDKARERHEVRLWIDPGDSVCTELGVQLELALGLDEAVVVPASDDSRDAAHAVGLALGRLLSDAVADGDTLGVGWGRTLTASLRSFRPATRREVRVLSMLGGTLETRASNPVEYSWRLASALGAECHLFPAPLIVDSITTRRNLVERCGLERLYELATRLDMAVVSVGDMSANGSALCKSMLSPEELQELAARGCIGEVLCHFIDEHGTPVDHPINDRVMSVSLAVLGRAGHKIIASGGASKAPAIAAAAKAIDCDTLVTDEAAARRILEVTRHWGRTITTR